MADDVDPTKTLLTARDKLIYERRGLAMAIALGYRRRRSDDPHVNEARVAFIEALNLIEAIDRAIIDEKSLVGTRPAAFAVAALDAAPPLAAGIVDGQESFSA